MQPSASCAPIPPIVPIPCINPNSPLAPAALCNYSLFNYLTLPFPSSSQYPADHFARHIREPIAPSIVQVSEFLMIEAKEMEHRRV